MVFIRFGVGPLGVRPEVSPGAESLCSRQGFFSSPRTNAPVEFFLKGFLLTDGIGEREEGTVAFDKLLR